MRETYEPPYDYQCVIDLMVSVKTDQIHEDISSYHAGLLSALESLFEIKLSEMPKDRKIRIFWKCMHNAVDRIATPMFNMGGGDIGEYGLYFRRCEERGVKDRMREAMMKVADNLSAYTQSLREYACVNFLALYGGEQKAFSSEDLLTVGVDDSLQPDYAKCLREYWENY